MRRRPPGGARAERPPRPTRIQPPAHVARPHAVAHLLAERAAIAPAGLAEEPLECRPAVVAYE
eukprot:13451695-Alexandrium_andersonii.AAC.1